MERLPIYGWQSYGESRYRHFCGARVVRVGKKWTARFVNQSSYEGHASAKAAVKYIEANDELFWTVDRWISIGLHGGAWIETAFAAGIHDSRVFVASVDEAGFLDPLFSRIFEKHLFGAATCAKCLQQMTAIKFEPRTYFQDGFWSARSGKSRSFIVCNCGHPLWRGDIEGAKVKLRQAEASARRRHRLKSAEGEYTEGDIARLVSGQNAKCFYCDALFTPTHSYTIDHIEPLMAGGSNWPENLCLACRNCNFSKGQRDILEFVLSLPLRKQKVALRNIQSRFPVIIECMNIYGARTMSGKPKSVADILKDALLDMDQATVQAAASERRVADLERKIAKVEKKIAHSKLADMTVLKPGRRTRRPDSRLHLYHSP